MKRHSAHLMLAVIPIGLLGLSFYLAAIRGPFHYGSNMDPEFCYLFNSLNLLTINIPNHTDHPGTTLQEIGAVVFFLQWLVEKVAAGAGPLIASVLGNPENYLTTLNVVLNLLISGVLYAAALTAWSASGSLVPALALEFSVPLFGQAILAQFRVAPEPLLIATGLALAVLLLPAVLGDGAPRAAEQSWRAFGAGAIFSFGFVTKVNFLPLALLVFVFPGMRQRLRFVFGALASFAVFAFPIVTQLGRVFWWVAGILTHEGRYGTGPRGFPDAPRYWRSVVDLFGQESDLFWCLGLYVAVVVLWRITARRGQAPLPAATSRLLIAGGVAMAAVAAVTAQHPIVHYLAPAVAVAPLLNAVVADQLRRHLPAWDPRFPVALAGILLLATGLVANAERISLWALLARGYRRQTEEQLRVAESRTDCEKISVYRSSLLSCGLALGNIFSHNTHAAVLEKLYPGTIHYHMATRQFRGWRGGVFDDQLHQRVEQGRCVLVQGSPEGLRKIGGFRMKSVVGGARERLWRLEPLPPKKKEAPLHAGNPARSHRHEVCSK